MATALTSALTSTGEGADWSDPAVLPGDRAHLDLVFSLAYEELYRLAATVRRRDPAATLSPATLVNEAWMKLAKTPEVARTTPLHFKRIAARAMRQVLVTAARRRSANKREAGPGMTVAFDEAIHAAAAGDDGMLALEGALLELGRLNPRQAQMVESRFFGGLEMSEIADLLDVSEATVLRDWRAARAWLAQRIGR